MEKVKVLRKINLYLLTWVGSYLLILIIPMILGISVYRHAVRVLTEQVEQINCKSMVEMRTALDASSNALAEINTTLTLNPDASTLSTMQSLEGTRYLMTGQNAQRVLSAYSISNRNIDTLGLYFEELDYLITDRGSARGLEDVFNKLQRDFQITSAQWDEIRTPLNQDRWYLLPNSTTNLPRLIRVRSLLSSDRQKNRIVSLIAVDMQRFTQPLHNMADMISGDVWLIADDGTYITTATDNRPLPVTLADAPLDIGVYYHDDLAVLADHSQLNGWKLVAVTSKSLVLDKVSYIKAMIWLQIMASILIGGVLAYLLARHYYLPINKISKLLVADSDYGTEDGESEIRYVQHSLKALIKDKQAYLSTIEKQDRELCNSYLCKAVSGKLDNIQELRDRCNIKLTHSGFVLVGFYVQDFSKLFHNDTPAGPSNEDISLISIIIQNIADEVFSELFETVTFETNGMMVALINLDPVADADVDAKLAATCHKTISIFKGTFCMNVSASISNTKHDYVLLPEAFKELQEIMEYVHVIGEENMIIHYEEMSKKPELKLFTQDKSIKELLLLDAVRSSNFQYALSMIDDVTETYTASGLQSTRLVRIRIYALIASLLDAFSQCGLDAELLETVLNENHFSYSRSAGELQRRLTRVLTDLSELKEEDHNENIGTLTERIKEFIQSNYHNPNLGVSTIADQFHLNISYLSRAFKKQESQGLLDYIHSVRITRVKELLRSNDSIKEISVKSGYYNSLSMIRVFKRYEGTTPGKYREEHCSKG